MISFEKNPLASSGASVTAHAPHAKSSRDSNERSSRGQEECACPSPRTAARSSSDARIGTDCRPNDGRAPLELARPRPRPALPERVCELPSPPPLLPREREDAVQTRRERRGPIDVPRAFSIPSRRSLGVPGGQQIPPRRSGSQRSGVAVVAPVSSRGAPSAFVDGSTRAAPPDRTLVRGRAGRPVRGPVPSPSTCTRVLAARPESSSIPPRSGRRPTPLYTEVAQRLAPRAVPCQAGRETPSISARAPGRIREARREEARWKAPCAWRRSRPPRTGRGWAWRVSACANRKPNTSSSIRPLDVLRLQDRGGKPRSATLEHGGGWGWGGRGAPEGCASGGGGWSSRTQNGAVIRDPPAPAPRRQSAAASSRPPCKDCDRRRRPPRPCRRCRRGPRAPAAATQHHVLSHASAQPAILSAVIALRAHTPRRGHPAILRRLVASPPS